jgi:hypothetical protein
MEDAFWQGMADATGGTVLPCDGSNKAFRPGQPIAIIEPSATQSARGPRPVRSRALRPL